MDILSLTPTTQIVSYIVTVVIGGVVYKYLDRWLKYQTETKAGDLDASRLLIESLMSQMTNLTTRITTLEAEREAYHKREIEITKQFTAAAVRVEELQKEVDKLKESQYRLRKTLEAYERKYGDLDSTTLK
jgi:chromosome segregation ATPase